MNFCVYPVVESCLKNLGASSTIHVQMVRMGDSASYTRSVLFSVPLEDKFALCLKRSLTLFYSLGLQM